MELQKIFDVSRKKMSIFLDLFTVLVSESIKTCIEAHIHNGKTLLNSQNICQIIIQIQRNILGMTHIDENNFEFA